MSAAPGMFADKAGSYESGSITLPFLQGKGWEQNKLPSQGDTYLPTTRETDESPTKSADPSKPSTPTLTHDQHHSDNAAVIASKHYDQAERLYRGQLEEMHKYLASLDQQPQMPQYQQPMSFEQFNSRYNAQDQKALRNQTLSYLAIALPMAAVFGAFSRGGVWGALGALGQGLSALTKGHEEKADADFKRYQEYAAQTEKMNQHLLEQYKTIMSDRHWTFEEKMRILENLAGYYGDERLRSELGMYGVLGNLNNKNSLLGRHNSISGSLYRALQKGSTSSGTVKPDGGKPTALESEWRDFVIGKGEVDPFSSQEAFNAALAKYPITSFKKSGESEKKTGKENIFGRDLDETEKAYDRYFFMNFGFHPWQSEDNARKAQGILPMNEFDAKDFKNNKPKQPAPSTVYGDTQ